MNLLFVTLAQVNSLTANIVKWHRQSNVRPMAWPNDRSTVQRQRQQTTTNHRTLVLMYFKTISWPFCWVQIRDGIYWHWRLSKFKSNEWEIWPVTSMSGIHHMNLFFRSASSEWVCHVTKQSKWETCGSTSLSVFSLSLSLSFFPSLN